MTGKMKQKTFIEILGWAGIGLILTAYLLVTLGLLTPQAVIYPLLNGAGAVFLILSSWAKRDFQPVVLNAAWLLIAVIGITASLLE
ncbi:hypothetical protein CL689_00040 [Candidatus Saccharibacteria bacterium]|nr:hypothetical protein [Candidatus Saccharibacteria bacterium]|tara:strand:- start:281 stop:538 length:258 start_codon:yes stop_codon:yes gene_type:complete